MMPTDTPPQDDLAQQCRQWADAREPPRNMNVRLYRAKSLMREAAAELARLRGIEQAHRDLVGRVDAHVATKVFQKYTGGPWYDTEVYATGDYIPHPTRAEAEAAYRRRTGLGTTTNQR